MRMPQTPPDINKILLTREVEKHLDIVYQTSRLDLMDLEEKGLLKSRKLGRTWYFTPAENLEAKLAILA